MQATSSQRRAPWLVFLGCCVLSFLGFGVIVNTPGQYFSTLRTVFHVSQSAVALTVTVQMLVGSLMLLVGGKILERYDSRKVLFFCVAVVALSFLACSMVTAFWQFYVIFAVMGAAYAIPVLLAPQALLSNWFEKRLGMVMGIALGLSGLAGAIFQPIVVSWIGSLGWRGAYALTAVLFALIALPCTLLLRFAPDTSRGEVAFGHEEAAQRLKTTAAAHQPAANAQPDAQTHAEASAQPSTADATDTAPDATPRQAFRSWAFTFFVLSMVLLQIASGLVQHVATFEKDMGLAPLAAASVVTGIMIGAAIGKGSIGALLDRFNATLVVLSYVVFGIAGWLIILFVHAPGIATVGGVLAGIGQGYLLVAIPWMIRQYFGASHYAQIYARAALVSNVMLALSTGFHGVLYDVTGKSYLLSFSLTLIGYVLATVLGLVAFTHKRARISPARTA